MKQLRKKSVWALMAVALLCALPHPASAGLLCAEGTSGFACAGPGVANLAGFGPQSITNVGLTFLLADGLLVHFDINETITGNFGPTTSATLRLTNIVAANLGGAPVSDNIYIFSDLFNPSIPGTAGVGAIGIYGAIGPGLLPTGGFYGASSQAQMNYLFAPAGILGAPFLSLTTPATFAIGAPLPAVPFYEWARSPMPGGVVQLVGGLNFTLDPGSEIYLPGSLIIDENDPDAFASEAPEPGTFAGIGSGMVSLALLLRRRRR